MNWKKARFYNFGRWVNVIVKTGNVEKSDYWWGFLSTTEKQLIKLGYKKISYKKLLLKDPHFLDNFPEQYKNEVVFD